MADRTRRPFTAHHTTTGREWCRLCGNSNERVQSGNGRQFSALLVHRTLANAQKFDCGEPFFDIFLVLTQSGCWGGRVRRETGRRLKVQVLYGEGLASHTGPESCVAVREDRCEALTGECVGQPLSGENQLRGADVLRPSEGNTACVDSARRSPTPRRRRPWHAQNPSVREPGDLQAVRGGHCTVGKAGGHSRR